jgi:hypothetical protein
MVEANEAEPSCASALSSGSAGEGRRVDSGSTQQSGVDGGFQRLVSNRRWPAGRPVDRAGFLQSLPAERPVASRPKLGTHPPGLHGIVPKVWLPHSDSHGQWGTFWFQGARGTDAVERLVEGVGHWGRIYQARAPGAKWRPRADAPCSQSRNDAAALAPSAGAATASGSLGQNLQLDPSPPSLGTKSASGALPSQAGKASECAFELSQRLDGAPSASQRRDQMEGEEAVCWRGLCWVSGRIEGQRPRKLRDLFWRASDWRDEGHRQSRDTSGPIYPCHVKLLDDLGSKKHGRQANLRAQRLGRCSPPARYALLRRASAKALPPHPGCPPIIQCVTHVYARFVTHVCARCPPRPSPTPRVVGEGVLLFR